MTDANFQPRMVSDDTFDDNVSAGVRDGSALDALQAALAEETRLDTLRVRVPRRKSIQLIVDPNIDGEAFQRWQRNSMVGKARNPQNAQYDAVKLSAVVLANTTVGIEVLDKNGEYTEVRDSNGAPMNFQSPEFRQLLVGDQVVPSGTVLVRKLFGNDGHMMEASGRIVEAAGYGEEDEEGADPLE